MIKSKLNILKTIPHIETFISIEEFDGSFEARFSDETSPFVFSYSDEDGEETVFRLITREAPIPGGGKTKKNKEKQKNSIKKNINQLYKCL